MADEIKNPKRFGYFSRVREVREQMKQEIAELYAIQKRLILEAAAKGDFESALKANQWLIEHTPNEDGERVIDPSASKPKEIEAGPRGPQIQIGIKFGGVNDSPQVIDVTPVKGELNE